MGTMISAAVAAIVATLNAGTPVCPAVYRVRVRPVSQDDAQAVVVRPEQSEVVQRPQVSGMPVGWSTTVSVECYQRSEGAIASDLALDALVEAVYARLMTDPTLSDAVVQLVPKGISFDFDVDGEKTACANLVFNVLHRTHGASLA